MLDLDYFSYYSSELGFRVGVECLHQNAEIGFFAVIVSLNPPASFYDADRADGPADVVNAFTEIDWSSTNHSVKFTEGMYQVEKTEPTTGMNLIFDVKKMDIKTQDWIDYGWTLLPIFSELETDLDARTKEYYVRSGVF